MTRGRWKDQIQLLEVEMPLLKTTAHRCAAQYHVCMYTALKRRVWKPWKEAAKGSLAELV